ncbi:MAG: hypothetical protein MZW92_17165 [Comamonadaceae bacterium]|nr:hypothetical protein [Comamonadaceae bacterium]
MLTTRFPKGYLFLDFFEEKPQREKLEEMAREFFSQTVTLSVETIDNGPGEAERPGAKRPEPDAGRTRSAARP